MNKHIFDVRNSILWKKISYSYPYQKIRFPERTKVRYQECRFFLDLLGKESKLIFDVGANTGEKAAIFKKLSKNVICFEPSPNSIRTLRKRFAFSKVVILPIAISNRNATDCLYVVENMETLNSINPKQLNEVIQYAAGDSRITSLEVQTDTLDNMIEKYGKPQYIKIDVEGSEREVISGLSKPVNWLSFENCTTVFLQEGLLSIDHLQKISEGAALFNIYECGKFLFRDFIIASELKSHLKSHNYGAAEIFCKTFPF